MALLSLIFVLAIGKATLPQVAADKFIESGMGYSDDAEQLSSQKCFDVSETSGQAYSEVKLNEALSYDEIKNEFSIGVSLGGSYKKFSGEVGVEYLRSIEDTQHTVSFNYYSYIKKDVKVQVHGTGKEALNQVGLDSYTRENGKRFGILCGNKLIDSYKKGAYLLMGLNLKFLTHEDKETVTESLEIGFADIVKATLKSSQAAAEKNVKVTIELKAFQAGGDPTQLSKIFNSADGNVFECTVDSVQSCLEISRNMLRYANQDFSSQIQNNDKVYVSMGIEDATLIPITQLNLNWESLVTEEIRENREKLVAILNENEYYVGKLYPFVQGGYPVDLHPEFKKNLNVLSKKVDKNIKVLRRNTNGAIECWNNLERCSYAVKRINADIRKVNSKDLDIFKPIEYMFSAKLSRFYKLNKQDTFIYNRGKMCNDLSCWDIPKIPNLKLGYFKYETREGFYPNFGYSVNPIMSDRSFWYASFQGTSRDFSSNKFVGDTQFCSHTECSNDYQQDEVRIPSPFFFGLYEGEDSRKI